MPECAVFGPTSHACYVAAGSGVLIGIGLTPAGWARLHGGDISRWADRIAPMDQVFPALTPARDEVRVTIDPAAFFDRLLLDRLAKAPPESPAIDVFMARLLDPAIDKVEDLGAGLGLNARQVGRLTERVLDLPPSCCCAGRASCVHSTRSEHSIAVCGQGDPRRGLLGRIAFPARLPPVSRQGPVRLQGDGTADQPDIDAPPRRGAESADAVAL